MTHTIMTKLAEATRRSHSHNEIVTVLVPDLADALVELEQLIDSDTQEIDCIKRVMHDDEHTYHDVWGCTIGQDGMIWRLTLGTPRGRRYCD